MNELIKVVYGADGPTVSARELHEGLEIKTAFKDWFPRMAEYGFEAGKDFNLLKNERVQGVQHSREHSYWTQKGRLFLYELLKQRKILPLMEAKKAV